MLENLTAGKLLGGTAIGGILIATWDKIKVYLSYIWGLFFVRVSISGSELRAAFFSLLRDEFKIMSFSQKNVSGAIEYVRPIKRNQLMAWLMPHITPCIWRRGWRFLSTGPSDRSAIIGSLKFCPGIDLSFIRGTFDTNKLIQEAINKYNNTNNQKDWKIGCRFRIIKRGSKQLV